tara:strand:+ start:521 stop:1036 length:516 start_codon:yes stop_codon:yes gene_type:complete
MIGIIGIIIFLIFFYRIPDMQINMSKDILSSPCSGKIIKIEDLNDSYKLYIFMSPLDAHLQIIPFDGKIIKYEFIKGKKQLAYKIYEDNYRSRFITHINTNYGMIEIIQNTGVLARRIKNNLKLNDNVKKGDILGIIKFGSRVDITIPKTFKLLKGLNDKVFIGDSFAKLI